jgi:hypothetical protein
MLPMYFLRTLRIFLLLTFSFFVLSCNNDNSIQSDPVVQNLPSQFRLSGEAQHTAADGSNVTCQLDLIFEMRNELSRSQQAVQYSGVHGGEVFRTVLAEDGSGFGFHADVFGEVQAYLYVQSGIVNLAIPINTTADGRFWREMASFSGIALSDGTASGTWTCAPLDLNQGGYVDTSLIAEGHWRFEPIQQSVQVTTKTERIQRID